MAAIPKSKVGNTASQTGGKKHHSKHRKPGGGAVGSRAGSPHQWLSKSLLWAASLCCSCTLESPGSLKTSWCFVLTPGDADVSGLRCLGTGIFKAPQVILMAAKVESHCFREMEIGILKKIIFLLYSRIPLLNVSAILEIALGNCQSLLQK